MSGLLGTQDIAGFGGQGEALTSTGWGQDSCHGHPTPSVPSPTAWPWVVACPMQAGCMCPGGREGTWGSEESCQEPVMQARQVPEKGTGVQAAVVTWREASGTAQVAKPLPVPGAAPFLSGPGRAGAGSGRGPRQLLLQQGHVGAGWLLRPGGLVWLARVWLARGVRGTLCGERAGSLPSGPPAHVPPVPLEQ